jgi:uncharacterized membrane protein YraQ (UPF0718 family)
MEESLLNTIGSLTGQVAGASWDILLESVLYIFIGFVVAGLLKAFLPADFVHRHLGRNTFRSILKASLLGMPLPL